MMAILQKVWLHDVRPVPMEGACRVLWRCLRHRSPVCLEVCGVRLCRGPVSDSFSRLPIASSGYNQKGM